jgi:hypothetical protein
MVPIVPSSPIRLPVADQVTPRLTERSLFSFAVSLTRPGVIIPGSVERIEYSRGIPCYSVETLNGRAAARTEFDGGYPALRKLDLDLDGRFETIERYNKNSREPAVIETDFDGDGVFEKENPK